MAIKFLLKQWPKIKSPQFYEVSLLYWLLRVSVINAVTGEFSGEDLARVTVQLQVSDYRCLITTNCLYTVRLRFCRQTNSYSSYAPVTFEEIVIVMIKTITIKQYTECPMANQLRQIIDDVCSDVIALYWCAEFLWIAISSRLCPSRLCRALFIPLWKRNALSELLFVGSAECF